MKELNKTNRLTIVVVAIVLVIVAGLLTLRKPDIKYVLSPAESLRLVTNAALFVTPEQAKQLLNDNNGKTVFIDVRNSIAFDRDHVKNAVNIPVRELFDKKNKSILSAIEKSGQTAVIYGETQQQANGAWMMLQQTGYKNMKLFTGYYSQFNTKPTDTLTMHLPLLSETPLIDTAALKAVSAPKASGNDGAVKTVKKAVVPAKKAASSGGGC